MGDYPIVRRPKAIFYHGGVAGVAVGGSILPSLQVKSVAEAREDPWYCSADDRFCFITTDIIQAWHNALVYEEALGAGAVYRVEPVGRLHLDICKSGRNFACVRAVILARGGIPAWVRSGYKADRIAFADEWITTEGRVRDDNGSSYPLA